MAETEFLAASTWAELVGTTLFVLTSSKCHDLGRRAALLKQSSHRLHCRACVREEQLQARAQVVLARIAVFREGEPIFRAAAVTQRPDFALLALGSQQVSLVVSELAHFLRCNEFQHVRLMNVSQLEFRFDEMIARIEIPVGFQCRAVAAGRRMNA